MEVSRPQLGGSDLGPRDLEELPLPALSVISPACCPRFHVALARKACNRFALSPAFMGLGPRRGLGAPTSHPPRWRVVPTLRWEDTHPGVLHGGPCMCCPLTWLPLGLLCQCPSTIPSRLPNRDPLTTCQLTGPTRCSLQR